MMIKLKLLIILNIKNPLSILKTELTKLKALVHQRQRRRQLLQHHYQQQQLQHLLPHQTITVITSVIAMKVSLMRRIIPSITTISFPIHCNMSIIGLM